MNSRVCARPGCSNPLLPGRKLKNFCTYACQGQLTMPSKLPLSAFAAASGHARRREDRASPAHFARHAQRRDPDRQFHGAPRRGSAGLSGRQQCCTSFAKLLKSCVTRCGPLRRDHYRSPIDRSANSRSAKGYVAPQRLFSGSAGANQFRDAVSSCRRSLAAVWPLRTASNSAPPTQSVSGDAGVPGTKK